MSTPRPTPYTATDLAAAERAAHLEQERDEARSDASLLGSCLFRLVYILDHPGARGNRARWAFAWREAREALERCGVREPVPWEGGDAEPA